MSHSIHAIEHTVVRGESTELEIDGGCETDSAISSVGSSSISVPSVPFEVTGDGPTISLGLKAFRPPGEIP